MIYHVSFVVYVTCFMYILCIMCHVSVSYMNINIQSISLIYSLCWRPHMAALPPQVRGPQAALLPARERQHPFVADTGARVSFCHRMGRARLFLPGNADPAGKGCGWLAGVGYES